MEKWYLQSGPESDVVLSTEIYLFRNLEGMPFPERLSLAQRREISDKVGISAAEEDGIYSGKFRCIDLDLADAAEISALAEQNMLESGAESCRKGSALLLTEDDSIRILVNGEDHIRIQSVSSGLELDEAYLKADALDNVMNRSLRFAFDETLGYLTQNPEKLGTGMHVSLKLHLPALSDCGAVSRIASNLAAFGLTLYSFSGPFSPSPPGAVYRLSNHVTLGITEEEAVSNLKSIALQVVAQEREERLRLSENIQVQDTISRSLGVLRSARLLKYDEFLNLLSIVRLGISVGLVQKFDYSKIDSLAVHTGPAVMAFESGRKMTENEAFALRASLVRSALDTAVEG